MAIEGGCCVLKAFLAGKPDDNQRSVLRCCFERFPYGHLNKLYLQAFADQGSGFLQAGKGYI